MANIIDLMLISGLFGSCLVEIPIFENVDMLKASKCNDMIDMVRAGIPCFFT